MARRRACAYGVRIVKHVLVNAAPPMLHSVLVETLSRCADIRVIDPVDAGVALDRGEVDVVLTAASDPDSWQPVLELLWRCPRSRVVVVAAGGRRAAVYELIPRQSMLGDLCPRTLMEAILR